MKNLLLILPLLIVGCATTIDTSTPRAQALMQEVRAERLVAEAQNNEHDNGGHGNSYDEARDYNSYCYNKFYGSTTETSACVDIAVKYLNKNPKNVPTLIPYLESNQGLASIKTLSSDKSAKELENIKQCMVSFASNYEARIDCMGRADNAVSNHYNDIAHNAQISRELRVESCSHIDAKNEREKCRNPSLAIDKKSVQLTKNQTESQLESKGYSFLQKLAGAVVEGVVEGVVQASVNEALDLNCDEVVEVSSKTKQVIPGSPQYGSKTKTTVKTKRCP
jgi:hypothetical protein